MAAVTVFVDDAIRGRLPLVCAKTGGAADLVIRMRQPVGRGLGAAPLLLLLLGPFGLVGLFLLAVLAPGQEYLTVRVPEAEASYRREKQLERFRTGFLVAGVVVMLYGVARPGLFPVMWLVLGAGFLVAGVAVQVMVSRQAIGVSIDASRRWVTLTGVHPAFVQAIDVEEAAGRIGSRL